MFLKILSYGLTVTLLGGATSFALAAEIYQWTDEKGTVHFTDDASKIPREYSERARIREAPVESGKERQKAIQSDQSTDRVKRFLEEMESKIEMKKNVEKKLSELENELRLSEKRLKWIEDYEKDNYLIYQPFVDPKTGRLVPVVSPYFNEKIWLIAHINAIKKEVESLEAQLFEINRKL